MQSSYLLGNKMRVIPLIVTISYFISLIQTSKYVPCFLSACHPQKYPGHVLAKRDVGGVPEADLGENAWFKFHHHKMFCLKY